MLGPRGRAFLTVALVGAAAGCNADPAALDTVDDGRSAAFSAGRAPVLHQTSPIFDEFGSGAGVTGEATLTRSSKGIWLDVAADGLTPGHAYTVWAVIFDNARGCGKDGCGIDDLESRKAQVTLANAGGFVAAGASTSAAMHIDRHDLAGREVLLGRASGIDNTYRAEVHIIVRSHGIAETDPANLARQLGEVDAFCNLPAPDVCLDVGVAIFAPPKAIGVS